MPAEIITAITFPYIIWRFENQQNISSIVTQEVNHVIEQLGQKYPITAHAYFLSGVYDKDNRKHELTFAVQVIGPQKDKSLQVKTLACVAARQQNIKPSVSSFLDSLMQTTQTEITVRESEKLSAELQIVGSPATIDYTRVSLLFGFQVASIPCSTSLQPILAGLKRQDLNDIMLEEGVSVYLYENVPPSEYPSTIYITGPKTQEAKRRTPQIVSKNVVCLPKKLDWLSMHCRDQIKQIEADNAVHLTLPPIGSQQNIVSLSGTRVEYCGDIYVASIQTMNIADNQQSYSILLEQLRERLGKLSATHQVEFYFSRNIIDIYGLKSNTMRAYNDLTSLDNIKSGIRDTKFQIELGLEHRDFINGKKNGKINKIVKTSSCRIAFQETLNEYNMLIDIYSPDPSKLALGVHLLEDELPAEISFYIPETFHKRIIGVSGKNIQKIMKKFGVYVKFSNAEEYAMLGGYYDNQDNVIARTPAKNQANLKDLKQTIIESVNATELLEELETVLIPHQLWSFLVSQFKELRDNKITLAFGDREKGSDTIQCRGPVGQVQKAKNLLLKHVPAVEEFPLPVSPQLSQFIKSKEYESFLESHKDAHIFIYYPKQEEQEASVYIVNGQKDLKKSFLGLLSSKMIPTTVLPRTGSMGNINSQNYFNSKLFNVSSEPQPSSAPNFSLFGTTAGGSVGSLRELFDDSAPPGLKRSGSDLYSNILNEPGEFLRNSTNVPPRMGPLISSAKSVSMSSLISTGSNFIEPQLQNRWSNPNFVKSLSSNPTEEEEMDQKMVDQVLSLAIDKNDNDLVRIQRVLESIGHERYIQLFVEHEIDFPTFLSLEDADLKELGIKALGSRKKILAVIRQFSE
ncbi:hypothetical protein EDD86DRAFT_247944 [Gorgonomyces haynaldii]|nr:hypothetical protein EDD86DRAFT_247944 [Gorgonomyces haynaldii]